MTTPDEMVAVRGLRKAYGGRTVVDNVDLDVRSGEIVGIIGANGAGKTTTVECIQGLRRADSGSVRVVGLDPVRQSDRLRPQLGSQLQDSALPDRLRVDEAIALFSTARARRADDLLAQFGLIERRRSAFAGLSGGERQRLFLVLALLNRPRLVILDELTQGLDPAARRDVWAAVQQLRADGTTVLLVTHELDEAEALCDRVIAMRAGRILDSGAPSALVARHAGWAKVRFSWPGPADELRAALLATPGVQYVAVDSGHVEAEQVDTAQFTVHGERRVIAHVGAELVHRDQIPADLRVEVPDLESALIELLEADTAPARPAAQPTAELIGANR